MHPDTKNDVVLALARDLHQVLNLEHVLDVTRQHIVELMQPQKLLVLLVDEEFRPVRWCFSDDSITMNYQQLADDLKPDGLLGQALYERRIVSLDCTTTAEADPPPLLVGQTLVAVPLQTLTATVGVLLLAYSAPHMFSVQQEVRLIPIAELIAQALQNAVQYTYLAEQLSASETGRERVVHDIRGSMMAISASMEVIRRALEIHPTHRIIEEVIHEALAAGQSNLRQVVDLTNDLLGLRQLQIKAEFLNYEVIPLELLFDEITDGMHGLAIQQSIMVRYRVTPRTLQLMGDIYYLRRLLVNLMNNALRFTPEGGIVLLTAAVSDDNDRLLITVEDTGPGVAPEDRTRIFYPFVRGKIVQEEDKSGIGLGLAICREIVHAHKGAIWVEDRLGGGSRFCVTLPTMIEHSDTEVASSNGL